MKEILSKALIMLGDEDPVRVIEGIELISANSSDFSDAEARVATEAIVALFGVDMFDRPDLRPSLEKACDVVASFGSTATPVLLEGLDSSDLKAQLWLARCLGSIGADAIDPMLSKYRLSEDPYVKALIIYAFGKMTTGRLAEVIPLFLEAFKHEHREIRDTAARTVGKLAEHLSPDDIDQALRAELFEGLFECLADEHSGVRAKSARSIGKLSEAGFLTEPMKAKATRRLKGIIGEDKHYAWDKAYIVRKESSEALTKL